MFGASTKEAWLPDATPLLINEVDMDRALAIQAENICAMLPVGPVRKWLPPDLALAEGLDAYDD